MTTTQNPNPPRYAAGPRANRWNTPLRRAVALSALGVAAVTLAACGSSSSASTTSAPPSAGSASGSGSGAAGGGARQFPGASGTIAAINGASLEVQNPTTGQTTVNYLPTTTFDQSVTTTASSVTVGSCISAFGRPTSPSSSTSTFGRPVTATTVSVSQPTAGSCTGGLGGRAGFGGGTGRPGGGGFPGGQRPAGATGAAGRFSGQFGAASGPVTAVNGSTVTVSETNPSTKKVSSVVVTLTSSTAFTERQSAASTDLAVGKCANAVGTADTTGAVTARSITISTPGANGCTTGFGRFGGAPGGPGGAGGAVPGGSTGA